MSFNVGFSCMKHFNVNFSIYVENNSRLIVENLISIPPYKLHHFWKICQGIYFFLLPFNILFETKTGTVFGTLLGLNKNLLIK